MMKTLFLGKDDGFSLCGVLLFVFAVSFLVLSLDELVMAKERLWEKEKAKTNEYIETLLNQEEELYVTF